MEAYKDYLIILSPPTLIAEQVKKFKRASARLIGDFEGMHSKAHISLECIDAPSMEPVTHGGNIRRGWNLNPAYVLPIERPLISGLQFADSQLTGTLYICHPNEEMRALSKIADEKCCAVFQSPVDIHDRRTTAFGAGNNPVARLQDNGLRFHNGRYFAPRRENREGPLSKRRQAAPAPA